MYMPTFQDLSDDIYPLTLRWPWRSQNHNSRVICQKIQKLVKYAKIHIEESICQLCEDIHHFTLRMRWLWRSHIYAEHQGHSYLCHGFGIISLYIPCIPGSWTFRTPNQLNNEPIYPPPIFPGYNDFIKFKQNKYFKLVFNLLLK